MKTIELTVKNVRKAFKEADEKGKKLLRNLCGEDVFSSSITDRVQSYEAACEELGIPVRENWDGLEVDEIAYIKLKTIVKALNEGWEPNWSNSDETKYWVWFYMKGLEKWYTSRVVRRSSDSSRSHGGVELADASGVTSGTYASYGSRLAFKNRDLAVFCGNTFAELWAEFFLKL